jgi:hypothetical protein
VGSGHPQLPVNPMENQKPVYLTVSGLPLSFEFEWPFHPSTSGADFQVLHGTTWLEDGSGLHAEFAIHLSQTMHDLLPSLGPGVALPYVINVVRKVVETKDLEFLKSGKRQPIPLSSRFKNFRQNTWRFMTPSESEVRDMLRHTVFWVGRKLGRGRVLVTDEINALYTATPKEKLLELARQLSEEGLIQLDGEYASPAPTMLSRATEFEKEEQEALAILQQKHAFESAHKS